MRLAIAKLSKDGERNINLGVRMANNEMCSPSHQTGHQTSLHKGPTDRKRNRTFESRKLCKNCVLLHGLTAPGSDRNARKRGEDWPPQISFWNFVKGVQNFVLGFRREAPRFRFEISFGCLNISFWDFV